MLCRPLALYSLGEFGVRLDIIVWVGQHLSSESKSLFPRISPIVSVRDEPPGKQLVDKKIHVFVGVQIPVLHCAIAFDYLNKMIQPAEVDLAQKHDCEAPVIAKVELDGVYRTGSCVVKYQSVLPTLFVLGVVDHGRPLYRVVQTIGSG